uniref:Putative secreted protein n=1 Tax=uncultured Nocardioidaceae bacterium TaxID=253824 RepID=A0A6J4LF91_9ACTN|nr:MAG: putative secreted protein [uncultured Nocardioidaceae bacterium]
MLATTAVGLAGLGYAAGVERRAYALRRVEVPVLASGSTALRILHISDLHLTPSQSDKQRWVRGLAGVDPHLVVNTGDNLAHKDAIPNVLDAFGSLLDRPGVFVFGSNDYFAPVLKNPVRYLLPQGEIETPDVQLPHRRLRAELTGRGWLDLTNRRDAVEVGGQRVAFAGVDDPHLEYDDLDAVAGPADPAASVSIGVAHAPYLRVLDRFNADGHHLLLAGHTHGGQLCVPGVGALVTNCDLDRKRVKGLHRHQSDGHPASWLHVSAGLGTSPFAPVRFSCRPEATLLTLVAR